VCKLCAISGDESTNGENKCLLLPQEKIRRRRCGDGYITDRDLCLECNCCYVEEPLPGEQYTTAMPCYAPITCQSLLTSFVII